MEVREGGECTEVRSTREGSNRSVLVAFAAPLPTTRAVLLAISGGSQEAVREVAGGWGWGLGAGAGALWMLTHYANSCALKLKED